MIILGFFAISLLVGVFIVGSSENQIRVNQRDEHRRLMDRSHFGQQMFPTQPMGGMYPPMYHDPYYEERLEGHYRDRSNFAIFAVLALSLISFAFFLQWTGVITIGL